MPLLLIIQVKLSILSFYIVVFLELETSYMSDKLPIYEVLSEAKSLLQSNNTLILQAPPGAGKSTVLPLELLDETWLKGKKIILLEPRRLAAKSVAQRLADSLDEPLGKTVGYRIRFDHKISKETRIEVVTEGILTRKIQQDNALEGVGLIIFDEFHERSLNADLALALSREVQQVLRDDLKLLIMSATLDFGNLSQLLNNAPVLESKGRQYPIEHFHIDENPHKTLTQQVSFAVKQATKEQDGDILVFLPGIGEINKCLEYLNQSTNSIIPLHGSLPLNQQRQALLPTQDGTRKVVLATSIAETSLTIEGIKVVIDCGYARIPRFDPRSGLTKLDTIRVSQDTADQRAGRAGRTSPGVCYRLWAKGIQLEQHRKPEILEADLSSTILELTNWGIQDFNELTWLTHPPKGNVAQAYDLLQQLKATDLKKITSKGKEMLTLPTHPRIAHLLLEAKTEGLLPLAIDIASLLEEKDPLPSSSGTDINKRIEALQRYRNHKVNNSILKRIDQLAFSWYHRFKTKPLQTAIIPSDTGKLLALAYPDRIAKKRSAVQYQLANNRTAKLQDLDDLAHEEWLAIGAMNMGNKDGRIFLASPLHKDDIQFSTHHITKWDNKKGEVVCQLEKRIGNILLEAVKSRHINEEDSINVICEALKKEGKKLLPFTKEVENWQARVMSLKAWRKNEDWPDVTTEYLIQNTYKWLSPYLTKITKAKELDQLNLLTILQSSLPWELAQQIDTLAPVKIEVPSGSNIKLQYFENGQPPVLAVRLQEVFGLLKTPKINNESTSLLLHLLSPGFKPVQVTNDLHSFWENTYIEVKKELKRRYPKHSWPEDPWTALAVKGVKRKNK